MMPITPVGRYVYLDKFSYPPSLKLLFRVKERTHIIGVRYTEK